MAVPQIVKRMLGPRALAKIRSLRGKRSPEQVFTSYYEQNYWANDESRSGPGSSDAETAVVRQRLPQILREIGATSMLDIPCGDFEWMRKVDLGGVHYTGADIVSAMIERNIERFRSPKVEFARLDLVNDPLPRHDLVLCRDCLFHLNLYEGTKALKNIKKSGASYLLTTTHPSDRQNSDIHTGGYRALDLTKWPYNLPEPIEMIMERPNAKEADANKALGLWRIDAIELA